MYEDARFPEGPASGGPEDDSRGLINAIYILYLIAILFPPVAIVGVVLAYVNRKDAPFWLGTHYTYQIRTFWIGFAGSIVGSLTTVIAIGFIVLLVLLIWWIVRCAKGMKHLGAGREVPEPYGWGW